MLNYYPTLISYKCFYKKYRGGVKYRLSIYCKNKIYKSAILKINSNIHPSYPRAFSLENFLKARISSSYFFCEFLTAV